MITAIPGDKVLFDGHEWNVWMTSKSDAPTAMCVIDRPEHPGRACGMVTLMRMRQELTVIPRPAPVYGGDPPATGGPAEREQVASRTGSGVPGPSALEAPGGTPRGEP